MDNYQYVNNLLVYRYANKGPKDKIYNTEWNDMIKTMATQLNVLSGNIDILSERTLGKAILLDECGVQTPVMMTISADGYTEE